MEQEQNNAQEEALEIALKAEAFRDGLGHLRIKLGMINPDMPIEEQLEDLADYHKVPDPEAIKLGENQLVDGYIKNFFESQVKKYFQDYPQAYDVLDEKSDNLLVDYAALGVKYNILRGGERDETFRRQSIDAYYRYLVEYEEWLLDHIHDNKEYSLTQSTPEGFEAYYALQRKHTSIVDDNKNPMEAGKLINEVMNKLFPDVKTLKEKGLSDYLYDLSVTNMIVGKYEALGHFLIYMGKDGQMILQTVLPHATEPLGIDGIYSNICQVENELEMSEDNRKTITDVKAVVEALRKNYGGNPSNGGCFGMLLLLLSMGASGLAMMFALIL